MTLAQAVSRPNCTGSIPLPTGTMVNFTTRDGEEKQYFFPGEWEPGAIIDFAAEVLPELL